MVKARAAKFGNFVEGNELYVPDFFSDFSRQNCARRNYLKIEKQNEKNVRLVRRDAVLVQFLIFSVSK